MSVSLSVVVPCYNEQAVLPETGRRLKLLIESLVARGLVSARSRVYFVDDGSTDQTWSVILSLATSEPFVGLKLSRNCGHQNALLAGLLHAGGDVIVSVDADLQDDLRAIETMMQKFNEGYEIVLGVRETRGTDTLFKRMSAELYYKLLQRLGVEITFNHADYRLMSRCAIEHLRQFTEVNMFLRGVIPVIGLRTTTVAYGRAERFAGESKYPLRKMLALAWDGITSFSTMPLRAVSTLGAAVFVLSIASAMWVLYVRVFTTRAVPGWASTMIPMYFLGGVQLLAIGVVGEYLSKVYKETKRRPRFFVEKMVGMEHEPPVK
jgi:glycosyltransferase involved in cell wall biosynthesis